MTKTTAPKVKNIGNRVYVSGKRGDWDTFMWVLFDGRATPEACPIRTSNFPEHFNRFTLRDEARQTRDLVQSALVRGQSVYVASRRHGGIVSFRPRDFKRMWSLPQSVDAIWRELSAEAVA